MGNLFNSDFQDFLRALWLHEVRYVLVGSYSVIMHSYSRTTGDLDLWVEKSAENYERLMKAFHHFGMSVFDMTAYNFLDNPTMDVFTFGRPPVAIDIITQLKGPEFAEAYAAASAIEQDDLTVRLIQYQHPKRAARATKTTWTT